MRRVRAFTLVELLIAIAIIAMLAAILLPTLTTARERARRTACVNNLRQFAAAFEMYADDWYERFPAGPAGLYGAGDASYNAVTATIYPDYIKTAKTFWCASAIARRLKSPSGPIGDDGDADPNDDPNDWYACYAFVFGLTTSNHRSRPVPVVSDRGYLNETLNAADYPNLAGSASGTGNHPWGITTLFLDGSVRWMPLQEIDYSSDVGHGGAAHAGNVACQKDGYSVVIATLNDRTEWGQE